MIKFTNEEGASWCDCLKRKSAGFVVSRGFSLEKGHWILGRFSKIVFRLLARSDRTVLFGGRRCFGASYPARGLEVNF